MMLQIELEPRLEEVLGTRARLQGLPVEDYAHKVLQEALSASAPKRERATQEEFRAFLEAMAASSEGTKQTAEQTYDRDFIYGDHP